MKIIYLLFILLTPLLTNNCNSQKMNNGKTSGNDKFFIIGSGGGFTGEYKQFKVHESGEVEKLADDNEEYEHYSELEKSLADSFFQELETLHIADQNFIHPGDMSFYLGVMKGEELHMVKWGDERYPMDKNIKNFFEKVAIEIYKKER